MPVSYILSQTGAKMGLTNPSKRPVLLRFLNEAAKELYDQSDMPGSLMEQVFKVNGDQTISLPSYVGKIRGMREWDSHIAWSINQMRPRYNQFNWTDMWRNFRLLNTRPIMKTITNVSALILSVPAVESPAVVVSINGPTENSTSTVENITMSSTTIQTSNNYLDVVALSKNIINKYDITIEDVDGNIISIIPNNELTARYQIVDVSQCPWLPTSSSPLEHYLEILYKKKLPYLSDDSDEFPAQGYDDIIVNKMLQLWAEEQGKVDIAAAYDQKATRSLARATENENRATEDVVSTSANPHDSILPRVRRGRRRFYRGFGFRGYGY